MRNFYLTIFTIFTLGFLQAQIIDIPDVNFKDRLVNTFCVDLNGNGFFDSTADFNDDGEIQLPEAEAILRLDISPTGSDDGIIDLEGIQYFSNLIYLNCANNDIEILDCSLIPEVEYLVVGNNGMTSILNLDLLTNLEEFRSSGVSNPNYLTQLDFSENINLKELFWNGGFGGTDNINLSQNINLEFLQLTNHLFSNINLSSNTSITNLVLSFNNNLAELDTSQNINLISLSTKFSPIVNLDLSQNTSLEFLSCSLFFLETLNLKNGSVANNYSFNNSPQNLTHICIDPEDYDQIVEEFNDSNISLPSINTYCSFTPGGEFYTIEGENKIDANNDGCDNNDSVLPFMKYSISSGSESGNIISNESGSYYIPVQEGVHIIMPQFENPAYFSISPSIIALEFPSEVSPFVQDFCITPNGDFNDLEVIIIPLDQARPGFETDYKLIYKNKGTTILSGSVDLVFTDDVMNFVSSSPVVDNQMPNQLSWSYNDLQPFETREIVFTMNLNTPTDPDFPLNGDDILEFAATIVPNDSDETPNDNIFTLNQVVVNSFDPNDKTCLEGEFIREESVGEYVHYMIRFENTGTANAINVVIKDEIDLNKYDISTLIPLNASHDFVTRIQNTNEVEFIFENINLPFDDANNDGYVVFKIKTLETLTIGDTFSNDAEIYFDFNFPIITNDYTTTVEDNLSVEDQELNSRIKLFPNPVNDNLFITSEVNIEKVSVYDINGRLLQTIVFYGNETQRTVDLQKLAGGVYVIKLSSKNGELTQKIIKE